MSRFKAIAFISSYLWNIENPILEIQVQECVGKFEARSVCFNNVYEYTYMLLDVQQQVDNFYNYSQLSISRSCGDYFLQVQITRSAN